MFNRSKLNSNSTLTPNITSSNFTKQSSTPTVLEPASSFVDNYTDYQSKSETTRSGNEVNIYKLTKLCGTCIAKDKAHGEVALLTTSGVVTVKFSKEYFSLFDK